MENLKVISNSSPLIYLLKVDQIDLIEKLFGQIIIPNEVYQEVTVKDSPKTESSKIEKLVSQNIITIKKVKDKNLVRVLRKELDSGEAEVIALALEIKADLIIVDEIEARKIAGLYDINKTGFIGLLIKAQSKGLTNNVKEILDLAIFKGFWINQKLYREIIKKLLLY